MREDEGFLTPARMVVKRVRGMEWNSPYPEKGLGKQDKSKSTVFKEMIQQSHGGKF